MKVSSLSARRFWISIVFVAVVLCAGARVQHVQAQATAQIGPGSPLPVFVTNPSMWLPEGFAPESRWKFSTWTTPSVITWIATVKKTSGGWANLTISTEDGQTSTKWYYVPAMPGSWERQ